MNPDTRAANAMIAYHAKLARLARRAEGIARDKQHAAETADETIRNSEIAERKMQLAKVHEGYVRALRSLVSDAAYGRRRMAAIQRQEAMVERSDRWDALKEMAQKIKEGK